MNATRTNEYALNNYLACIRTEELLACKCGASQESIHHFLFYRSRWENERRNLRETIGGRWGDLAYALGGWSGRKNRGTQQYVDGPCKRWKPNMKVLKAVIQYVKATKRFQPRAVVAEETGER
jgi:hypothetical protein